ncbi:MAG: TonB C-terminal domain-containing protein [Rhodospirillaceae bacterium]
MTDGERIAAAVAVSLTCHYVLLFGLPSPAPVDGGAEPVIVDLTHADVGLSLAAPITLEQAAPAEPAQPDAADRRRTALVQYLDTLSETVHAHRLSVGAHGRLIGNATFRIVVDGRGRFASVSLVGSSGDPTLDADAFRALHESDGAVRRPGILGIAPLAITLTVKYQYGL